MIVVYTVILLGPIIPLKMILGKDFNEFRLILLEKRYGVNPIRVQVDCIDTNILNFSPWLAENSKFQKEVIAKGSNLPLAYANFDFSFSIVSTNPLSPLVVLLILSIELLAVL